MPNLHLILYKLKIFLYKFLWQNWLKMNLSEEQINRYSRQIVLKEVGGIGQKKLLNSRITVVGLGALGSPVAYYLAAAGIGTTLSRTKTGSTMIN